MPSNAPDLNFGPSERYLPGKKLLEGDVLKINILDFESEEVDTDYGSKLEFHLNVLSSSTDVVSPGKYTWRTVARAARKVHAYLSGEVSEHAANWVWELTVMENGVSLKTLNSDPNPSGSTTTPGSHVPDHGVAGDGEA
jgi:predicted secreted protein